MVYETVRTGVVGLGTIWSVVQRAFRDDPSIPITALCDPDPTRLAAAAAMFPDAFATDDLAALLARDDVDAVEVLVPSPAHCEVACAALAAGKHVQLQKPMASTLDEADRIVDAAAASGRVCRITEDYLFMGSVQRLRSEIAAGAIGEPVGVHMKLVATGRGGWDVDDQSWRWLMPNTLDGRGVLTYDHGWHQLAVAYWLFGPFARMSAWVGATPVGGDFVIDAPTTLMWDHASGVRGERGVRGVFDITYAPDTYWASDYYGGDERIEVTGTRGYARINWLTARGIGAPVLEIYREGEVVVPAQVDGDWAAGLVRSTRSFAEYLRGERSELWFAPDAARHVLAATLAATESSRHAGAAVPIPGVR